MEKRHHIVCVIEGTDVLNESGALATALSLARNQGAVLSILVLGPALPGGLSSYHAAFDDFLRDRAKRLLESARKALPANPDADLDEPVIAVRSGHAPHILAIQYIMQEGCDLLIKTAEPTPNHRGFRALDMGLLRKCPIPLLLYRSQKSPPVRFEHIAVAIDPGQPDSAEYAFAKTLLESGLALGNMLQADVSVISCWESFTEDYLRNHIFARIDEQELNRAARAEEQAHFDALSGLVQAVKADPPPSIRHPRGRPEELIPRFVSDYDIDLLVMGTVARTGIPGFLIGNTAENVLQGIECSLLALKPPGFVCPVQPA